MLKKKSDLAIHLKSKIAHYASSVMKSFGKDKDEIEEKDFIDKLVKQGLIEKQAQQLFTMIDINFDGKITA